MLAKLKETIEENYKKQRKQIIEKNKLFLEKYTKKIEEETENLDLQLKKVAFIQEIERMPKYRFYTHLDEQLPTKDDPVLRFIPYIPNDATHYELFMYEGIELGEKPFNKEMHLNESMLREILKKYSDIKLFHLKKLLGNKEIEYKTIKREYLDLLEFSMYSKMQWNKILNFWENTFDKKRVCLFSDPDSLDYYFCNVCYTFDCWTHENLTNLSLKIKKKTISFLENEEIHLKMCVDTEESNNEIELERILNTFTEEYDFINNNYDVDPCTAALFFNFCTKEKLPNHIFPKCKETFLVKKDTQLFTKRKGDLTFYFPCQHIGNCTNNPDCTCDQNKINCEEFCLCLECDNLFEGCECKDCSTKCKCFTSKRECSFTCNCTNCNNKIFTLKKYKKTYIGKSAISNFGLFAGEFIEKDSFICEYSGELISNSEAERRGNFYEKRQCSYLFDVSNLNKISHHTLDAIYVGNNSRFANHSIKPNIQAKNFLVNGIRRIGFFALFDIRKHTELFFDYNYKVEHKIAHGIIE